MGRASKRKIRRKNGRGGGGGVSMAVDGGEDTSAVPAERPLAPKEADIAGGSSHSHFKKAVAEKKALKKQVTLLKAQRKKLRKKFVSEAQQRRELNKKIKDTLRAIQLQEATQKAAGEDASDVISEADPTLREEKTSSENEVKGGASCDTSMELD